MKKRNVMVCVTQQKTCERLILSGISMIRNDHDNLYVIHVVNEKQKFLNNDDDGEALEYLFQVSRKAGAELTVLRSKDVVKAMEDFGRKNNITHVIMGSSPNEDTSENKNIALNLRNRLSDVEFIIL